MNDNKFGENGNESLDYVSAPRSYPSNAASNFSTVMDPRSWIEPTGLFCLFDTDTQIRHHSIARGIKKFGH